MCLQRFRVIGAVLIGFSAGVVGCVLALGYGDEQVDGLFEPEHLRQRLAHLAALPAAHRPASVDLVESLVDLRGSDLHALEIGQLVDREVAPDTLVRLFLRLLQDLLFRLADRREVVLLKNVGSVEKLVLLRLDVFGFLVQQYGRDLDVDPVQQGLYDLVPIF